MRKIGFIAAFGIFLSAFVVFGYVAEAAVYSRFISDPFDAYSYDNIQNMVNAIRAEGHSMPTGHPRIFIRNDNKEAIRAKIASDPVSLSRMQMAVNIAEEYWGVTITHEGRSAQEPQGQPVILANAIIYQLGEIAGVNYQHAPAEYGAEGVRHLMDMAAIDTLYVHVEYLGMPLGYDWLFDLMTDEQRQTVADKMMHYAQPGVEQVRAYNNPPGARLLGAMVLRGDSQYADQGEVNALLDLFYKGMVFGDPRDMWEFMGRPRQNVEGGRTLMFTQLFVPEGPGSEGIDYSSWFHPLYPILIAWRDQTGEDYFKLPFLQRWVEHYTHLAGNEYQYLATYANRVNSKHGRFPLVNIWMELGLVDSNRNMAALAKHHYMDFDAFTFTSPSARMIHMLIGDPDLDPKSPAELNLPLTDHFHGANSVMSRSSWSGMDAAWAWFRSSTWLSVRNLGPPNDLYIWKNGALLLKKHVQRHDYDGGNRTNTMVLYDESQPGQTFRPAGSHGTPPLGIRLDYGDSLQGLTKDLRGYNEGLRFFEDRAGEYVYAFGEDSQSYTNANPDASGWIEAIPGWSRQFIWFKSTGNANQDHFVVFDRVEKNFGQTEHLRWNFGPNPDIRNKDTNQSVGNGVPRLDGSGNPIQGIWVYDNANRIVSTESMQTIWGPANARLFVDTLLPKQPRYFRMGGMKERNIDLYGNLRLKNLENQIYNQSTDTEGDPNDPSNIMRGMWRVQVTDPNQGVHSTYLHVMQATHADDDNPSNTTLLEGAGLAGAAVGNNIALFNQAEDVVVAGSVTVPEGVAGAYNILFADLEPGSVYSITVGSAEHEMPASDAGTVFVSGAAVSAGDVIIAQKSDAPIDVTPPAISNVQAVNVTATSATITWSTDEAATSTVEYGTGMDYGEARSTAGYAANHSVTLTGLAPETAYHFRVRSADLSGNEAVSEGAMFTTGGTDTTPPAISNVQVTNVTPSSATITWVTDKAATSAVEYGLDANYGQIETVAQATTSHSVTLPGLVPETAYHFRVVSADAAGNSASSEDAVFATLRENSPPVISIPFSNYTVTIGDALAFSVTATDEDGDDITMDILDMETLFPGAVFQRR